MYETEKDVLVVKEASSVYNSSSAEVMRPLTIHDLDDMPEKTWVELYNGKLVYMYGGPEMKGVTFAHQDAVQSIYFQTQMYINKNRGKCKAFTSPIDVQLDVEDETTIFLPDFFVICDKAKMKDGRYVIGAPDWVVEVLSPSTRKRDMHEKKDKYLSSGVREYWMVDTEGEVVIIYKGDDPDISVIRNMSEPISVGIYDGDLMIDLSSLTTDDEEMDS